MWLVHQNKISQLLIDSLFCSSWCWQWCSDVNGDITPTIIYTGHISYLDIFHHLSELFAFFASLLSRSFSKWSIVLSQKEICPPNFKYMPHMVISVRGMYEEWLCIYVIYEVTCINHLTRTVHIVYTYFANHVITINVLPGKLCPASSIHLIHVLVNKHYVWEIQSMPCAWFVSLPITTCFRCV